MQLLRCVVLCLILASSTIFTFGQSGEVVPNENLVVDGIPKIPASLAESVERYSNFGQRGWQTGIPRGASF